MDTTAQQFNQSPLGEMASGLLVWMGQETPEQMALLPMLQTVLEERIELLPQALRKQKALFLEMIAEMQGMEVEQILDVFLPRENEVSPVEAADQLAEELKEEPESLPQVLLQMLQSRDL